MTPKGGLPEIGLAANGIAFDVGDALLRECGMPKGPGALEVTLVRSSWDICRGLLSVLGGVEMSGAGSRRMRLSESFCGLMSTGTKSRKNLVEEEKA